MINESQHLGASDPSDLPVGLYKAGPFTIRRTVTTFEVFPTSRAAGSPLPRTIDGTSTITMERAGYKLILVMYRDEEEEGKKP